MNEEGDGGTFRLIDEWETEEDLGRYRKGESFRVFLGALKTLCVDANIRCETSSIAGEEGSQKEKPYQFRGTRNGAADSKPAVKKTSSWQQPHGKNKEE